MKKRISLLLAALLLASLTACGPDDPVWRPLEAGTDPDTEAHALEEEEGLFNKQDLNQYRVDSSSEEDGRSASWAYDPVVSSPYYSGQEAMLEDFQRFGQNLPAEIFWIDEAAVREAFGVDGYLSATCRDGLLHFDTYYQEPDGADLAEQYGVSLEEWESREMKSWPWSPWRLVGTQFNFFAAVRPEEEPPEPESWKPRELPDKYSGERLLAGPYDEEGNLLPTPSPKPVDREALADYQPPEWAPVTGHEGYEAAVVASTDAGIPLCVRVRWQREGFWFLAEIPGHALDAFWEHEDGLFMKVDMRNAGYDIPAMEENDFQEGASVEASEAE